MRAAIAILTLARTASVGSADTPDAIKLSKRGS
jgi:hypothetical protein